MCIRDRTWQVHTNASSTWQTPAVARQFTCSKCACTASITLSCAIVHSSCDPASAKPELLFQCNDRRRRFPGQKLLNNCLKISPQRHKAHEGARRRLLTPRRKDAKICLLCVLASWREASGQLCIALCLFVLLVSSWLLFQQGYPLTPAASSRHLRSPHSGAGASRRSERAGPSPP